MHGHDDGPKEAVARYLEKIGFDPIILHEQASRGMTVQEKLVANSDVSFAVVLLTPDDIGRALRETTERPRARQNVWLELGYFIGLLGREHVLALKKGDVEIPSDYVGVVYTDLDPAGAWKGVLAKELEAIGHEIDWKLAAG